MEPLLIMGSDLRARRFWLWTIALCLAMPLSLLAQAGRPPRRVLRAVRTQDPIVIDGLLSEAAWQTAEPGTNFIQKEPSEGEAASEWTEFRILYDDQNFYVGFFCHDRTPSGIVVSDIRRDFDSMEQDYVAFILDTFQDRTNGYYMATTPAGGLRDQQIFNAGRINLSWDSVWRAEGRLHSDGWSAEFAIPFKTLRFSNAKEQTWGLQVLRAIRRNNEATYWAPIPRRFSVFRALSYEGDLIGIENVEPGRNLSIKPYVLAGAERLPSRGRTAEADVSGGLDLKYGVTSGLTLDLTANTDFSHVEADTQQVNLTRFPLFFPEKREFFLENAGIFEFGAPERNEVLLFHSRKIGLVGGEPIPILGGARLTGRAGRNSIGLLNIQTRSEGSVAANNFTALRLRREILSSSNLGLIFLNRRSGLGDDQNRAYGADANFYLLRSDLRLSTAAARTETPGRRGDDRFARLEGEWQNALLRFQGSVVDIQKNFNPEIGFVRRPGRRIFRGEFDSRTRLRQETPVGAVVRDLFLSLQTEQAQLSGGNTETKLLRPQLQVVFQNGGAFIARYSRNFERLSRPFSFGPGSVPRGDYRFNDTFISYASDYSRLVSGSFSYDWGNFYDGRKRTLELGARVRSGYRLSTILDYEHNSIKLRGGAFVTDLVGLRLNYSFNARMFLDAFVQYNSETHATSSNVRFRLIHRPLSDIFVVYNEQRDRLLHRIDRSLNVKYTHLLHF